MEYFLFSPLTSFFKLAYYLGVVQFYPRFSKTQKTWISSCSVCQRKASLFIIWPSYLVYVLSTSRITLKSFYEINYLSTKNYFLSFGKMAHYIKTFWFFYIMLKKPQHIFDIINGYRYKLLPKYTREKFLTTFGKVNIYLYCVYILLILVHLIYLLFRYFVDTDILSPNKYLHRLILEARQAFLLPISKSLIEGFDNDLNKQYLFSTTNTFLGVFRFWLNCVNYVLLFSFEMFADAALPLCIWCATKDTELVILSAANDDSIFAIIDQLYELQLYSMKFNDVWAPVILHWLLECFGRLISELSGIVQTDNVIDVFTILTKVMLSVVGSILYADVYKKV